MNEKPVNEVMMEVEASMRQNELTVAMLNENKKLQAQLDEANKIIEFYATIENWRYDIESGRQNLIKHDCCEHVVGGKTARQYLKKYNVKDEGCE